MIDFTVEEFATHIPIMTELIKKFNIKKVLEIGPGYYSTGLLSDICNEVISIEISDNLWFDEISSKFSSNKVKVVSALDNSAQKAFDYIEANHKGEKFDMIFIDGDVESRWKCANFAQNYSDIIMIHDTEDHVYRWDKVELQDQWVWNKIPLYYIETSVLSSDVNVNTFISNLNYDNLRESYFDKVRVKDEVRDNDVTDIQVCADLPEVVSIRSNADIYIMRKNKEMVDGLKKLINMLPKNIEMIELGTWSGEGLSHFMSSGKIKKCHCVDMWVDHYAEQCVDTYVGHYGNVIKHKGKTADMHGGFCDNSVDFVYIDADHSYEGVLEDITNYLPKIKKGGIIGGHDYAGWYPGVIQAVDELLGKPDEIFEDTSWIKYL